MTQRGEDRTLRLETKRLGPPDYSRPSSPGPGPAAHDTLPPYAAAGPARRTRGDPTTFTERGGTASHPPEPPPPLHRSESGSAARLCSRGGYWPHVMSAAGRGQPPRAGRGAPPERLRGEGRLPLQLRQVREVAGRGALGSQLRRCRPRRGSLRRASSTGPSPARRSSTSASRCGGSMSPEAAREAQMLFVGVVGGRAPGGHPDRAQGHDRPHRGGAWRASRTGRDDRLPACRATSCASTSTWTRWRGAPADELPAHQAGPTRDRRARGGLGMRHLRGSRLRQQAERHQHAERPDRARLRRAWPSWPTTATRSARRRWRRAS